MIELIDDILSNRFLFKDFLWYALVSFAIFVAFCLLMCRNGASKKCITIGLLLEYLWLVLCFTVICRKKGELEQLFPIPFYDYGHQGFGAMWSEMVMNVIMFVPIGMLLKFAFTRLQWHHVLGVGLLLSATIEALQWIFKCGSCETNDLINNIIGTFVGYWIIKLKSKTNERQ